MKLRVVIEPLFDDRSVGVASEAPRVVEADEGPLQDLTIGAAIAASAEDWIGACGDEVMIVGLVVTVTEQR